MKRLAILISAPSVPDAQEALDDAVASIAAGATQGQHVADGTRVQFAWSSRNDRDTAREQTTEEIAEILRQAWECGLSIDEIEGDAFRLALRKIRGQAA
jgi:hypothetical protein